MGFGAWYGRTVFPRLMEWALSSEVCSAERRRALADARGEVLEIGFGTGLNLAHYPMGPTGPTGPTGSAGVTALTIIDSADLLPDRVTARIAAAPFPVTRAQLDAERLPFSDDRFDTVVSTWTLCSIPDPVAAVREIGRVLRPGGAFLFLEHGLSDRPDVARWQHRWNPIQRWIACGCNVDRPIDRVIADGGLVIRDLSRFVLPGEIRMMGEMYRGSAARS